MLGSCEDVACSLSGIGRLPNDLSDCDPDAGSSVGGGFGGGWRRVRDEDVSGECGLG